MAQRALPPGAIRRRAAFGLLDADGWSWAGLKAGFWFVVIIFLLGYVPNQAYFFTVSNTIEVGYNFASIVNWCPSENEDLPCPTPAGAILPWQQSPAELALPSARAGSSVFQSGTNVYVIGGATADGATADVLLTEVSLEGNFNPWVEGPALPAPRTDAALGVYLGVPFVIGGLDENGMATDTVFKGLVDEGALTGWEIADGTDGTDPLTLAEPLSGAGVSVGTSGFVLFGGRDAAGDPTDAINVAWVEEASTNGRLLGWQPFEDLLLPAPRADAVVASVGNFVYIVGGEGSTGATDTVFRIEIDDREAAHDEFGDAIGWVEMSGDDALPEPRTDAVAFAANGSVYVIGGFDASGAPTDTMSWAVSDLVTGEFADGWQNLSQIDLVAPLADAPLAGVGSSAFIFGGQTAEGITDGSTRAGLSPQAPFFQLGIAGATLPALAIQGEVGQQLGYLNAATVGGINFIVLILIGIAFAHQSATRRIISRLSGGRLAEDPDEEYGS